MPVTRIGLDLAKNVFQAHGVDEHGHGGSAQTVAPARRAELLRLAAALPDRYRGLFGLASLGARINRTWSPDLVERCFTVELRFSLVRQLPR